MLLIGTATHFSGSNSLDSITSKTVGDGQHGTARWATPKEIKQTYAHVPFRPAEWADESACGAGAGIGFGREEKTTALADGADIHCLMIGASGVGKTAFFLYPNMEYALASGMSLFVSDSKGDLARNYGAIAEKYYSYQVSVIDLRNPPRSDGCNFLSLVNCYMDEGHTRTTLRRGPRLKSTQRSLPKRLSPPTETITAWVPTPFSTMPPRAC